MNLRSSARLWIMVSLSLGGCDFGVQPSTTSDGAGEASDGSESGEEDAASSAGETDPDHHDETSSGSSGDTPSDTSISTSVLMTSAESTTTGGGGSFTSGADTDLTAGWPSTGVDPTTMGTSSGFDSGTTELATSTSGTGPTTTVTTMADSTSATTADPDSTTSSSETEGDPPGDFEHGEMVGMTDAHNAIRDQVQTSPSLPPLAWSQSIAEYAQEWADSLAMNCNGIQHRSQGMYGENIAMYGSSGQPDSSPEEVVQGWADEIMCWDYGTIGGTEQCDNQCVASLNSNGCGHYTQLVWADTATVGCGVSRCSSGGWNYAIWVCNYDPPGNYIGQTPY